MSSSKDQERTEQATPKRREDARKKGQVAQSREISSVMILLGVIGVFHFAGPWMMWSLTDFMRGFFEKIADLPIQVVSVSHLVQTVSKKSFLIVLPVLTVVFVVGIGANVLQVGFNLTGKPLKPKLSKLNPLQGLKKLVSLRSLNELIKSVLKIAIVGTTALWVVKLEAADIPPLLQMNTVEILSFMGHGIQKIAIYTCLVLILVSLSDLMYQRWQFEKDLKMTKQEVKEEFKQREGDPLIKARIRRIQTEMSRHRMMESVPDADVVVTNPTHFAVALRYDTTKMHAPVLVAKGAGVIAERIKSIAGEADIPIIENKPLARSLFRTVEIGGMIPADLYQAVAEILAYVYHLKRPRP